MYVCMYCTNKLIASQAHCSLLHPAHPHDEYHQSHTHSDVMLFEQHVDAAQLLPILHLYCFHSVRFRILPYTDCTLVKLLLSILLPLCDHYISLLHFIIGRSQFAYKI